MKHVYPPPSLSNLAKRMVGYKESLSRREGRGVAITCVQEPGDQVKFMFQKHIFMSDDLVVFCSN